MPDLFLLLGILRVIALVSAGFSVLYLNDRIDDPVQEIPVVADHDHGTLQPR